MFFKKRKPKRLYYPTKSNWYRRSRRKSKIYNSRNVLSKNLRTEFSRFVKDAFLYLVAGGVFVIMLVFFLFSKRFSISTIEVSRDNLYVDNAAVMELLTDYKGQSIFTFSKTEAEVLIHDAFPEFSHVRVKKFLPNKILIELESHPVIANVKAYYFSQDLLLPESSESDDIVDSPEVSETDEVEAAENDPEDEASSDSQSATTEEALETFDEQVGTTTETLEEVTPVEQKALLNSIGQAIFDREENLELFTITVMGLQAPIQDREFVIPTEDVQYISDAIKYFINLTGIEIEEVIYFASAKEVHLVTTDELAFWLLIDEGQEDYYREQLDKFDLIYKQTDLSEMDLAYIDLRVKEKLIYCPLGAPCDTD